MSLSVTDALRDGLGRTFERNGLQLIAVFLGLRLAAAVANDTLTDANLALARRLGALPAEAGGVLSGLGETPTPFALGLGVAGAYGLFLAVALLAEAARIVAVRTLVSDRVDAIPAEYRRRNVATATVNGFVGGIVVLTLTGLGLVFFVVPGLFLAVSFFFVRQEIAVRDVNFVDAMSGSWALSTGNRLELFALGAALVVVGLVASVPGSLVGFIALPAGVLVNVVVQAVVAVFGIASVARAYDQLRRGDHDGEEGDDRFVGALTADDLPAPDRDDAW